MAGDRKVKLFVNLSPPLAARYKALAQRYRVSQSELCRYVLERGYPAAAAWCQRTAAASQLATGASGVPDAPGVAAAVPDQVDAREALGRFAAALVLRNADLGLETFQSMVFAQAAVLGFTPATSSALIGEVIAAHFPGGLAGGVPPAPPLSADQAGEVSQDLGAVAPDLVELDPDDGHLVDLD